MQVIKEKLRVKLFLIIPALITQNKKIAIMQEELKMNKTNVFVKAKLNYFDGNNIPCPVKEEPEGWGLQIYDYEKFERPSVKKILKIFEKDSNYEEPSEENFIKGYKQSDMIERIQPSNYMLFDDIGFKSFYDFDLFDGNLDDEFRVKKSYVDIFTKHSITIAEYALEDGKDYKTSKTAILIMDQDTYSKFCYLIKANNGVLYRPIY